MQLALVKARATATVKHPTLEGQKFLAVLVLDPQGKPGGDPKLVIDQLGAGVGDTVLITSDGRGARELIGSDVTPARWYTLGIVDPRKI